MQFTNVFYVAIGIGIAFELAKISKRLQTIIELLQKPTVQHDVQN